MKPLILLKSFLAALLILIVTAAFLVAYFRDYSPEAEGHEHGGNPAEAEHSSALQPPAAPSHEEGGGDHATESAHPHQP